MNISTLSKKKGLLYSLAMFFIVIIALIFIGAPVQMFLGMVGLLITEILFLVIALLGAKITKASIKEMFPFKKPEIRKIIGSIFIWIGAYIFLLFATMIVAYLFPEGFSAVSGELNNIFTSVPLWVRFLIVAVSPAICEEAVHRGFIQYYLKPFKNKAVMVLIGGCLFGLFHLDPYRFIPTAILGCALAYLMVKTENIIYPMLIHMLHNSLSVLSSAFTETAEYTEAVSSPAATYNLQTVATFAFLAFLTPIFLLIGRKLLSKKGTSMFASKKGKTVSICLHIFTSAAFFIGGLIMLVFVAMNGFIFQVDEKIALTDSNEFSYYYDFEVEEDRTYTLTTVLTTPSDLALIQIISEDDEVVYDATANKLFGNMQIDLKAGKYTLSVTNAADDLGAEHSSSGDVVFQFILQ